MKIAVCITTRNRPDIFLKSLSAHLKYLPPDARIFVIDDASDIVFNDAPYIEQVTRFRFGEQRGVATAKNKCLERAYNWGADHIFLSDDDTYPIAEDWWKPYLYSKEPHLMYQFRLPGKSKSDMRELYRDDEIVAYSHTRGCMLYVHRHVLDVVGGMDTAYGEGMYEHTDWTNRIHNVGLTTYRAMDVPNSKKLLYCMDQDLKIKSSIPDKTRGINMVRNYKLYRQSKTSKEYKEFL